MLVDLGLTSANQDSLQHSWVNYFIPVLILPNQLNHYIFISEFNLLHTKNLMQHLHIAMNELTKPIFYFYFSCRKRLKNKFPLTGKRVCQTAYKFARENGIKGFSMKYEAAWYKWLRNFMRRHKYLKIKKATQISKSRATSLNQASVLKWFQEYITHIIKKYNIVNPRCIWNVD